MLHLFTYGVLLAACLGVLWGFVRKDHAEYAAFKLLTETADRQRCYRDWTVKSFLLFTGSTVVVLALLRRFGALIALPNEFHSLSFQLRSQMPREQLPGRGFFVGFGVVVVGSMVIGSLLGAALTRKGHKAKIATVGDIEPLMPRNGAETGWTALLSLNAGLSEELFFRMLLPLLLVNLLGNALLGFSVAAILFGLVHFYQGAVGVIATMILGLVFTGLYLWTGNLWIVIGVHAFFDLIGLVVRPTLMRMIPVKS